MKIRMIMLLACVFLFGQVFLLLIGRNCLSDSGWRICRLYANCRTAGKSNKFNATLD